MKRIQKTGKQILLWLTMVLLLTIQMPMAAFASDGQQEESTESDIPFAEDVEKKDADSEKKEDNTELSDMSSDDAIAMLALMTALMGGAQQNPYLDYDNEADPSLTPDGNASLVDHVVSSRGKEFFTFKTVNDNYFYLVIDANREDDNVYLLSAVDETDIADFLRNKEENIPDQASGLTGLGAGLKPEITGVQELINDTAQEPAENPDKTEAPEPKQNTPLGYILIALIMAVVIGVGYYFKIYRPKHDSFNENDLEFADDENYYNEDENGEGKNAE